MKNKKKLADIVVIQNQPISPCNCGHCDKQNPKSYLHKPIGLLGMKSFEGVAVGTKDNEQIIVYGHNHAVADQIAREIVRAVNAHEELLQLARDYRGDLLNHLGIWTVERIAALIAKAEGK